MSIYISAMIDINNNTGEADKHVAHPHNINLSADDDLSSNRVQHVRY